MISIGQCLFVCDYLMSDLAWFSVQNSDVYTWFITDTGGDRRTAKRLSKDLQLGLDKARTSLGMIEEDSDSNGTVL